MRESIFHIDLKVKVNHAEFKFLSCPRCGELSGLFCDPHFNSFRRCAQEGCNGFIIYEGMYANMSTRKGVLTRSQFSGKTSKERNKILKERSEAYEEEEGILD